MSNGRILFLHGYTQSSSVFYAKSSALRKKLAALGYDSVYLNGPLSLTPAQLPSSDALSKFGAVDDESTNFRLWWHRDHNECYKIEPAIETIREYIEKGSIIVGSPEDAQANRSVKKGDREEEKEEEEGSPIVGIIGFSQGAGLASVLVDQFQDIFGVPLKFAVLYLGFKVDTSKMPEYDRYYTKDQGKSTRTRLLHVVGELDTVVGEDRAYSFYDISRENSDLLKHPGGHFVPNSKVMIEKVTNWITALDAPAETPKPNDTVDDLLAMMDGFGK